MSSPPLTPIRNYMSSMEASSGQRQPLGHRRRSSSYSNNNRSPVTRRSSYSNHRLSNASRYSNGTSDLAIPSDGNEHSAESGGGGGGGVGGGGSGGGNLADELEFADEDAEWDENGLDGGVSGMSLADEVDETWEATQGANGGIDVAYRASPSSRHQASPIRPLSKQGPHRNFSRPMSRDSEAESPSDLFSPEMEDAMTNISRLANPPVTRQSDPAQLSKALSALQHLSPQAALETNTQRLTTSTNSLSSHLAQQTRIVASLSSSLFPPIGLATPLDLVVIEDLIPQMTQVLQCLPLPDPSALQGLSKLDRETTDLLRTLASLTDSLQMGKQATSMASRHLRNTLAMVTQLRRESDLAEQARWKIEKEGWDGKLAERWCASQCSDVVGGFEKACEGLKRGLEESAVAA